ncbi:MAG: S4 domain-containing protein, partial [Chlorobium sp.]
VAQYYSLTAAGEAEEHFDRVFVQKKAPDNIEIFLFDEQACPVIDLLVMLGAAPSRSEARRMIQQNAVTIDEQKITDANTMIPLVEKPKTLRAGKRKFYKVAAKKTF